MIKNIYGADDYFHFLHVMAILFVLNVGIMLLIGKIYPRKTAFVQKDSMAVDMTPWALAKPAGAVVCFIVISTYFIFT